VARGSDQWAIALTSFRAMLHRNILTAAN